MTQHGSPSDPLRNAQARAQAFNAEEVADQLMHELYRLRSRVIRLLAHAGHFGTDCPDCAAGIADLDASEDRMSALFTVLTKTNGARR